MKITKRTKNMISKSLLDIGSSMLTDASKGKVKVKVTRKAVGITLKKDRTISKKRKRNIK